jgi:polyribonucleotide nucleotidyltransferase
VEYEERLYAGGRIPGSFFRREGRPGTDAILTARLTDRPLRPLFQDGMRNEVQVIMFSLSSDGVNPLDILAINAASAAIMISDIPWGGPVGAVRVGRVNGEFVINPPSRRWMHRPRPAHCRHARRHPDGGMRRERDPRRCDGGSARTRDISPCSR